MTRKPFNPLVLVALWCVTLLSCAGPGEAADERYWRLTPYTVRVQLAVDSRRVPSDVLAEKVAAHLIERADSAVGAVWDLSVERLTGGERLQALKGLSSERLLEIANDPEHEADKLIVITLRESQVGFSLSAIECAPLLEWVGQPLEVGPCELYEAPDKAFGLLLDVFSPLALFDIDRSTGEDATLSFRGSQLPHPVGAPVWGVPGDVLVPILRRTDREGEVVEDGVQPAKWTYLVLDEFVGEGEADLPHAKVYSHARRPFGVRRRGRTEYFALLLRPAAHRTKVHLHVRDQPETPLAGYQAFVQDGAEGKRELLGVTDASGSIAIPPGASPIQMVYIKSGSQVVAKAPAPVGAVTQIDIPLLDERDRLEAEAKIGLLREELIDLIARRSILAARVRAEIKAGDKDQARKLLSELDGMPGRAQFSQKLNRVKQQSKAKDPVVQQRIDRLFEDTAAVLGAFLGGGDVNQLRQEINGG